MNDALGWRMTLKSTIGTHPDYDGNALHFYTQETDAMLIQINPEYNACVEISKEQALDLAEFLIKWVKYA